MSWSDCEKKNDGALVFSERSKKKKRARVFTEESLSMTTAESRTDVTSISTFILRTIARSSRMMFPRTGSDVSDRRRGDHAELDGAMGRVSHTSFGLDSHSM